MTLPRALLESWADFNCTYLATQADRRRTLREISAFLAAAAAFALCAWTWSLVCCP